MTRRNNEERAGARKLSANSPIPPVFAGGPPESENSFTFALPTEFVELPSRGKYYPVDHPLHEVENVEIRYMTAKDEDILTSKALLRKGVALDRLLQNVLVDKRVRVQDLLVGDKNAIMLAARSTGYGNLYETKITCPACTAVSDYEFDLDLYPVNYAEDYKERGEYKISHEYDNIFSVELPITEVTVQIKLLLGEDEKRIAASLTRKQKSKTPDSMITDLFKSLIVSVNGDERKVAINGFINIMPAMDSKFLREVYELIMPNVEMEHRFSCRFCGLDTVLEVPLTAEFFWPK
jgi:hypothetical protein